MPIKKAGCWGVKFQFRNVDTFYKHTDEVGDVLVYDELKKNSLSAADLKKLGNFTKKLGLKFGVSFFRLEDLAALSKIWYLFDFFKVPSAECFNEPLVSALVKQGKRVFVSTGGANTKKVSSFLYKISCDIIPMHCVANYPPRSRIKLGGY